MYLVSDLQTFIISVRKYAYPIGQRILPNYMETHVNMRGCKSSKRKTIPLENKMEDGPNNEYLLRLFILIKIYRIIL